MSQNPNGWSVGEWAFHPARNHLCQVIETRTLWGELAMKTDHLFGRQRRLFHRPAVSVERIGRLHFDLAQIRDENQRLFVERIRVGVNGEGCRIC